MKEITASFKTIYRENKGLLALMIFVAILNLGLFIFSISSLSPNSPVVKIGYGDIAGYRDGSWTNMLVFPLFAIILGILHNLLTVKIFSKRGDGIAKAFAMVTIFLTIGTFIVLGRLLGEI